MARPQKENAYPDRKKLREDGEGTGLIDGKGKSGKKSTEYNFADGGVVSTPKPFKKGGKKHK
jgi:hypothetical protein